MAGVMKVTGDDMLHLSSQLNALADQVHTFPFRNVGGMPNCGSNQVGAAADGANEHFELRSLLIETEIRDLADIVRHVETTLDERDARLASGGPDRINRGLV